MIITLGTRGSKLALWQSETIKKQLELLPERPKVKIVVVETTGDKNLEQSLEKIGTQGLFVKEIEKKILEKKIDIAVHSCKDLPSSIEKGLTLAAFSKREKANDVLISKKKLLF